MAIDVVGLIRGRKTKRAAGIEELAVRLAGGEAVAPEEIEAILDRTGCDEQALQERIDALERRAELRRVVADGDKARARLAVIDAEIDKVWRVAAAADEEQRRLRVKYQHEQIALGQAITYAVSAADALLAPENLSAADRERLAELRDAATGAAEALSALNRRLPELRAAVAAGEELLEEAADEAKRLRSNPEAQERKAYAATAVKTRTARLREAEAELPRLQRAAEEAELAVAAIEAELRSV